MGSLFRNHSPATILHDKKDTQAAILVRGRTRLSPQRPDDARPGTRLLPQPGPSRYKSRNPGTPIRNRDGGIADRTSHNAILFPGSDLHRPPGCFRDTPHPAPAVLWDRFFIPPLFSGRFYCYFDNKWLYLTTRSRKKLRFREFFGRQERTNLKNQTLNDRKTWQK